MTSNQVNTLDAVTLLAQLAAADPYTALEASSAPTIQPAQAASITAASAIKPLHGDEQASDISQPERAASSIAALTTEQSPSNEQVNASGHLSPQHSAASALQLLQQLLDSPGSDRHTSDEVNSRAAWEAPVAESKVGSSTVPRAGQHVSACVTHETGQRPPVTVPAAAAAPTTDSASSMQVRCHTAAARQDASKSSALRSRRTDSSAPPLVARKDAGRAGPAGLLEEASDWTVIDDFCSRTVPKTWLRLVLHGWLTVTRLHIKWRCIQQVCPPCRFP